MSDVITTAQSHGLTSNTITAAVCRALAIREFLSRRGDDQQYFLEHELGYPFRSYTPLPKDSEELFAMAREQLDLPSRELAFALSEKLGFHPDYLADVANPKHDGISCPTRNATDVRPSEIEVDGQIFGLSASRPMVNYAGNTEQVISRYQSRMGQFFCLVAPINEKTGWGGTRGFEYGFAKSYPMASLLNYPQLDSKEPKIVVIPQNLSLALTLVNWAAESSVLSSGLVVSGCIGSMSIIPRDQMELLRQHQVVLIPDHTADAMKGTESTVKFLGENGVEVFVYPFPMLDDEEGRMDATDVLEAQAVRLSDFDSTLDAFRHIAKHALAANKYRSFLQEQGILEADKSCQKVSDAGGLPELEFFDPSKVESTPQATSLSEVRAEDILQGIVMIYAAKNRGKSLVTLNTTRCCMKGSTLWGLFSFAHPTARTLYLDSETRPGDLKARLEQFKMTGDANLRLIAQTSSSQRYDLTNEGLQQQLLAVLGREKEQYLVLDNLTSLVPDGKVYSASGSNPLFAFLEEVNKQNVTALVVHHANEKPEADKQTMRGSKEWSIRSHTEIVVHQKEDAKADCVPSLVNEYAAADTGRVFGLHIKVCKGASLLEGCTIWMALGKNASEMVPLSVVDKEGKELWRMPALPIGSTSPAATEVTASAPQTDTDRILSLFLSKQELARKDVEEELNCGEDKALSLLKQMTDEGVLEKVGNGPATKYRLLGEAA